MTETNLLADTSKTNPLLAGLHLPPGVEQPTRKGSTNPTTPASRVIKLARETNDAYGRPFRLTRLNSEEERQASQEHLPLIRKRTGRQVTQRPALWADGPTDMAFLAIALSNANPSAHLRRTLDTNLVTDWAKERWQRAQDVIDALPKELTRSKVRRSTHNVRMYREGMLGRYLDFKIKESTSMLLAEHRKALTEKTSEIENSYSPLTARLNLLNSVQASLGNASALAVTNLGSTNSWNNRRQSDGTFNADQMKGIRRQVGDRLGDTQVAMSVLLLALRREMISQDMTAPRDLHEVFNMNNGAKLAKLAFLQHLLRETVMSLQWQDNEHDAIWSGGLSMSGLVSFSSLDIVCAAPRLVSTQELTLESRTIETLELKPTVAWDDGTEYYVYDGLQMDPTVITAAREKPDIILSVRNAEQRRALIRLVGTSRLLESVKAELVSEDDFGRLFVLPNKTQFVMVKNATVEPDGSIKEYILGTVGNKHKTARSGIASTWGLREDQYWPAKET